MFYQCFTIRAVVESNVPRTSNMEAPIMLLSGHSGEVSFLRIISGHYLAFHLATKVLPTTYMRISKPI